MGDPNVPLPRGPFAGPKRAGERTDYWSSWWTRAAVGSTLYLAVSGAYLYRADSYGPLHQWTLLFHLLVGFPWAALLLLYIIGHLRRERVEPLGARTLLGYVALLSLVVCGASGLYASWVGALSRLPWLVPLHLWSGAAGVGALAGKLVLAAIRGIRLRREAAPAAAPQLMALRASRRRGQLAALTAAAGLAAVSAGLALAWPGSPSAERDWPEEYGLPFGADDPFSPTDARTASGRAIAPEAIGNSAACGAAGCHEELYRQWYSSGHRFGSTQVFYRKLEELAAEVSGMEATRWCGGCHDPIALFSGAMTAGGDFDSPYSEESVSCIACHSISQVLSTRGNAAYEWTPPRRYLFADRPTGLGGSLNRLLIRADLTLHRGAFTRPVYSTPEYCSTCHKSFADERLNGSGFVPLYSQYDEAIHRRYREPLASGRAKAVQSVPEGTRIKTCQECHMPLERIADPAAAAGLARSHLFYGAAVSTPWLEGDHEQFDRTRRFLQDNVALVDIEEPRSDGWGEPYVLRGEVVNLAVVVTNLGTGHHFPTGVTDLQETWLEVVVRDTQGRLLLASGLIGPDGHVDPESTFYRTLIVDASGNILRRHEVMFQVGGIYRRVIESGRSDVATYSFKVPVDVVGDLTVTARLRYREFNRHYQEFVFGPDPPALPIIDLASDAAVLPVRSRPPIRTQATGRSDGPVVPK